MPRPREFDEERVLDAVVRTFWVHGYEGTSTEQLCEATGLGRSSLYNTFVGKRSLYERALDRYLHERTARTLGVLDGDGSGRDKVATLLGFAVDPDPDDPAGCFAVNAVVGCPDQDDPVARALARDRGRRVSALVAAVAAGQRDGSITSRRAPEAVAEFVVATINGLRVAACGGVDRATREAVARTALDAV